MSHKKPVLRMPAASGWNATSILGKRVWEKFTVRYANSLRFFCGSLGRCLLALRRL
jgi:hypothetical protein